MLLEALIFTIVLIAGVLVALLIDDRWLYGEGPSDRTYEQSRGHPTAPRERHPG